MDDPPRLLETGDAFFLTNAPAYVLANDQQKPPEDGIALFDWTQSDTASHGGDETVLLGGSFAFEASGARPLLEALPAFMHPPGA